MDMLAKIYEKLHQMPLPILEKTASYMPSYFYMYVDR
jgi:hypothetical protein